jgi:hypothetical protein
LLPVSGDVAWTALCALGFLSFIAGVWLFSRAEYA